jgi:putative transposase
MYSRNVVGWAMSSRIDAELVQEAWRMALGRRRPSAGLMHHSDRGSQYACGTYPGQLHQLTWLPWVYHRGFYTATDLFHSITPA